MPTCSAQACTRTHSRAALGQRVHACSGYTYLGLLLVLVLLGAGLARLGVAWTTAAQREQERELRFRGAQIAAAIGHYRNAREPAEWPPTLAALVQDSRGGTVRHHLRQLYSDPCTGRADWVLLPAPEGPGVAGVRSRAGTPRFNTVAPGATGDARQPRVSDWHFVYEPALPASPAAPADAAGAVPQEGSS